MSDWFKGLICGICCCGVWIAMTSSDYTIAALFSVTSILAQLIGPRGTHNER
jgi:hypothetical protein